MSEGLLIARLILGLGLASHGAQKLFGWFGGHGLEGTGGYFEKLGFRPGKRFALAAGLGELGGGLLVALGFLGTIGPALVMTVMLTAMLTEHRGHGFFAMNNGVELPLLYATGALFVAFGGPGVVSLDAILGLAWLWTSTYAWIAIGVAVVLAAGNLAMRRPASPAEPAGGTLIR